MASKTQTTNGKPTTKPTGRGSKKQVTNHKEGKKGVANELAMNGSSPDVDVKKTSPETLQPGFFREGNPIRTDPEPGLPEGKLLYNPMEQHYTDREWYRKENICHIRVLSGIEGTGKQKNVVPPYLKFFLTGVDAPRTEKFQVVETFGDWYIFFFGERPPIYTISGVVLNMLDHPWLNELDFYYDSFLRGTMATRNTTRIYITYGFQQIQGHILNFSHSLRADNDKAANFSMQVAVVKRYALSPDDGNRVSDSFILNKETLTAFKDAVGKDLGKRLGDMGTLKKIMNSDINPAGPIPEATRKAREDLTKKIATQGLRQYGAKEYV